MAEEVKKENKIAKFFRDYKSEFKKIVWPTKEETLRMSAVVLASIIIAGFAIWLLDMSFSGLIDLVAGLFVRL